MKTIGSPHPALGCEAQLLLLTSAVSPPAERIRRLLEVGIEWPRLGWLASRQRALPHLWRQLAAIGVDDAAPDTVRAELQPLIMVSDFTMGLLRDRLEDAVTALERAGVRVMLLKGAALGVRYYPSFADRPMGDLDLLVDPEATPAALAALRNLGWAEELGDEYDRFYERHHHLRPLRFGASEVRLELHTDLFEPDHPFVLPIAGLWERAEQVALRAGSAWVPDPVDAMIHLCAHFLWSHGGSSGAWRTFRDVDVLLRSGTISWDELVERAGRARATTCVYWTLRLARSAAGIEVGESEIERMRPPGSDFLLNRLEHHLVTGLLPSFHSCPSLRVSRLMWEAVVRPRLSGHGRARPWSRSELARTTFLVPQEISIVGRAAAQTQRLRAWGRYFSTLLRSPAPRVTV